jgi:acetoin utilization deacetylase AcuC-like enzyme
MSIGIISSDIFKEHDTSEMKDTGKYIHPESPQRIDSIIDYIKDKEVWSKAQKIPVRKINDDELLKIHTPEYISSLISFCEKGGGRIDEDTVTCTKSYDIARIAAGSVLEAVDFVMQDKLKKVFCIIRPPGHHALSNSSMGFCLFSNISLGAVYALSKYNLERIMIIDWDAHHGNGTEKIFYQSKNVFTVSWHQSNFWPFSGDYKDIGENEGYGYNLNIPVPAGFTDEIYIESFEKIVVPAARKYKPQLIFLAAGYDAHYKDTVSGLNVTSPLYDYLSKKVVDLSEELCGGKLISCLEGGYNLEALAEGVFSTLNLMQFPDYNIRTKWSKEKDDNIQEIFKILDNIEQFHPLLK